MSPDAQKIVPVRDKMIAELRELGPAQALTAACHVLAVVIMTHMPRRSWHEAMIMAGRQIGECLATRRPPPVGEDWPS